VPDEPNVLVGIDVTLLPLALPHTPFTIFLALQLGLSPPLLPVHVQFRGQAPLMFDDVPTEHFSADVDGAVALFVLFALPHTPFTEHACVLQACDAAGLVLLLQILSATLDPSEPLHTDVTVCVPPPQVTVHVQYVTSQSYVTHIIWIQLTPLQ
jgi:hypothetical protein